MSNSKRFGEGDQVTCELVGKGHLCSTRSVVVSCGAARRHNVCGGCDGITWIKKLKTTNNRPAASYLQAFSSVVITTNRIK